MTTLLIIIGIFLVLFFVVFYRRLFIMPLNHITLINGGVGSGKTTLAVSRALYYYHLAVRQWYVKKFILSLFRKKPKYSKPLLYSSQPVKDIPYVPLTASIIYGDTNVVPKSVTLWTEASLSASSLDYKTIDYEKFSKGIKLYRHRSLGGRMFIDTQAVADLHFVLKRSINSYVWIERFTKIPFFLVYRVRNMMLIDENSINVNKDTQKETRLLFVSKRVWKKFDSYNYYGLYKNVPCETKTIKRHHDLLSYDYVKLSKKDNKNSLNSFFDKGGFN